MTPLHVKILLHYHTMAEPYSKHDHEHAMSPATLDYTAELQTVGLIESDLLSESGWKTTERGHVFIEALLATPLPVQKWVMP